MTLHCMLTGGTPYLGDDDDMVYINIPKLEINWNAKTWVNISEEAKDLLDKMLQKSAFSRISIEDALKHSFITK